MIRRSFRFGIALVAVAVAVPELVGTAIADSTPVGALPAGPSSTITAKRGTLVAIALPARSASSGLVWRLARAVDTRVLRQRSEADVNGSVVVVFRAVAPGMTKVVYALTRGEVSSKARAAHTYRVRVHR